MLPLLAAGCGGGGKTSTPGAAAIPRTLAGSGSSAPMAQYKGSVAGGVVPGRLVIGVRGALPAKLRQIDARLQASQELRRIPQIGVVAISVPPGTEADEIAKLSHVPNVRFVAQDHMAYALGAPNDYYYNLQYSLPLTQWDVAYTANPALGGSPSTVISIVDTGIDLTHEDLAAKTLPGATFVAGTTTANDDNGHGTHCAGIAAAITDNSLGIAGTNPTAQLLPVKVLSSTGAGFFSDVASGITWAADNGANIISLSLGCKAGCSDPATSAAIDYAKNTKGVLVVVASGNDGAAVGFPASDPNSMAIAASDANDNIATFSNFGPEVSVAAPGVNIASTYFLNRYAYLSGTSMATPMVAGLAGLLVNATSTPATIRAQIEASADPVGPYPYTAGRNDYFGNGRINVATTVGLAPVPGGVFSRSRRR
ncbi:MAG: S8 family peptidase [Vulcanimicrobiaceae bacterium]